MHFIKLKKYYPPGGISAKEIQITNIRSTDREDVLVGDAILPSTAREKPIVIYKLMLENGTIEYRAVPALCPHQGADISRDELKADGNVYCSLHRRPICIYSEYNHAYLVEQRESEFVIVESS